MHFSPRDLWWLSRWYSTRRHSSILWLRPSQKTTNSSCSLHVHVLLCPCWAQSLLEGKWEGRVQKGRVQDPPDTVLSPFSCNYEEGFCVTNFSTTFFTLWGTTLERQDKMVVSQGREFCSEAACIGSSPLSQYPVVTVILPVGLGI